MCYKPVNTKKDFVRRFVNEEFGNRAPTWNSIEDYKQSGYSGLVHIRNKVVGGITYYNLDRAAALKTWATIDPKQFYISAMAPHNKGTIQGEVQINEEGWYLRYNTQQLAMREGFAVEDLSEKGLWARGLLLYKLCYNSWDWLNVLLERYPGHIVEFSSFSVNWGTIPGYNTVFWEIRNY